MKLIGVGLVDSCSVMFPQSLPKARRGRGCLISEGNGFSEKGVKNIFSEI